jgi:hypothetical protein
MIILGPFFLVLPVIIEIELVFPAFELWPQRPGIDQAYPG